MLNAENIAEMTGPEKLAKLEAFAAIALPGAPNGVIAEHLGITRRTYQGWRSSPEKIPAMAIMLMQEWATQGKEHRAVETLSGIAADFSGIAEKLAKVSEELKP